MKIGIGILAGGKSTRMGSDKAVLNYKGNSFVKNLVNEFINEDIIISANTKYDIYGVEFVEDNYKNIGPISGILEILKKSKHKYNFIVGVDMQNINYDFMKYLSGYISSDYKVFSVKYNDKPNPLGAIYSKEMIPILEEAINNEDFKLINLLKKDFSKIVDLKYSKFDKNILDNINTPSDYRKLQASNVFAICGKKNSGKTTFITKVVAYLKELNYRVAVIKHDGHDFIVDENTDTGKYLQSGVDATAIFSNWKYMIIENKKIAVNKLIKIFSNYDLIIIEGMKNSEFDKFEIVRKENSSNIISEKELEGIITDVDMLKKQYKISFSLNDIKSFSNFIIKKYINI